MASMTARLKAVRRSLKGLFDIDFAVGKSLKDVGLPVENRFVYGSRAPMIFGLYANTVVLQHPR